MKRALRVWAAAPPLAPIHVTPHLACNGAVYLDDSFPAIQAGLIPAGIHVALEEHKQAIEKLNAGADLSEVLG